MKRILEQLQTKWKGLAPQRRIMLAAALATVLVGGFVLMSRANQVTWAVLYANVDDATASDVLARLDARGIQHQLDGNGTRILVPADQLDTTRLALAGEGVTGQAVPAGFEEIFDNQGLSTTDFAQKVNYERGLEGELAQTLLAMEPVKGANVQLSIPEKSVFVGSSTDDTSKPTASVLLDLHRPLTQAEVDTVASLISSSVPGLTLDQVTVASTDGTLLKSAGIDGGLGTAAGQSASTLELTTQYESNLSQRLTALVRAMTGSPNAAVEVRADLDFTQQTIEKQEIVPESQVITAQQQSAESYEGTGAPPGGTVGVDGGPTTDGLGTTNVYTLDETTTEYDSGDKTITKSSQTTPTINSLGVAIVIPPVPEDAAYTVEGIQEAVASAANLVDDRDRISVIESSAITTGSTDDTELVTDPVVTPAAGLSPVFVILGVLAGAAFVMIFGVFRKKRKAKKEQAALLAAALDDPTLLSLQPLVAGKAKKEKKVKTKKRKGKGDESDELLELPDVANDPGADKVAMEEIRQDLEKILAESPESLASLLSTWMTK